MSVCVCVSRVGVFSCCSVSDRICSEEDSDATIMEPAREGGKRRDGSSETEEAAAGWRRLISGFAPLLLQQQQLLFVVSQ